MSFLRRIWSRISLWFCYLPLWKKILLFIALIPVAVILYHVVLVLLLLAFLFIMSLITGNETYEFIRPASDIASVEIICVGACIDLYSLPASEIPEVLDQNTVSSLELDEAEYDTFWFDFGEVRCKEWWNDPIPDITEGTIRIQYKDGSREWICARGTFYTDAVSGKSSMTGYYFDRDEFSAFLEKYGYPPP